MSEIEDRRQRAFEAAEDMITSGERPSAAVQEAVEVATTVKITDEAIAATGLPSLAANAVLRAGLTALGLEVVD